MTTEAEAYAANAVLAVTVLNDTVFELIRGMELAFRYPGMSAEVLRLYEEVLANDPELLADHRDWRDRTFRAIDVAIRGIEDVEKEGEG
jgi:hypothetical protein